MNGIFQTIGYLLILLLFFPALLQAEEVHPVADGNYIIPDASIDVPADAGIRMHTYLVLFKPDTLDDTGLPHNGETPASLACVYGLAGYVPGCPIKGTTALPTGGAGSAIALVDAYDNDKAEHDLNVFSDAFGLPECTTANGCFSVIYASGTRPPFNAGWADEHVLDIEWAHAMAPNAKIILVEAASGSNSDLLHAVEVASQAVLSATATTGGMAVVSNSWGGAETANEQDSDIYFQTPGVIYFASSGDYSAPARYPGSSPFVISAGGASVLRDRQGNFIGQGAWNKNPDVPLGAKSGGSGGPSLYEPRPAFQNIISKITGGHRASPDIAFDSDPATGVDVYSTYHGGWLRDGGTSVASPALAGVIVSADHRARSSTAELNMIYQNAAKNYQSHWHDVLTGNNGYPALAGYDFVSGLGTPAGYGGK